MQINISYHSCKGAILVSCFFLCTAFGYKTNEKNSEVTVGIVQENEGFTVSVKTAKNINIHFYMFTVDGRLVKELNINGSKRVNILQLEKGIYIYDFFSNDERIKNGQIELR